MVNTTIHRQHVPLQRKPFWVLFLLLTLVPPPSAAQLPNPVTQGDETLSKTAKHSESLPANARAVDQIITKLQTKLEEARVALNTATSASEDRDDIPRGLSEEHVVKRKRLLQNLVLTHEKHIDFLQELKQTRQSRRDLKAESDSWQGFTEPPPYSIDLVDNLRDDIAAHKREIHTIQVERTILEASLKELLPELRATEQNLRKANEQLEKASDEDEIMRLHALRDLNTLAIRHHRSALASLESQRWVVDETLAYQHEALTLLKRKLKIASTNATLTESDRDAKLSTIAGEREAIEQEIKTATRTNETAQETLQKARNSLRKDLQPETPQEQLSATKAQVTAGLQAIFDTRKAQADTATQALQSLKLIREALAFEQSIWESRYVLAQTTDNERLNEAYGQITRGLESADLWKSYFVSNLDATGSLINIQQERLSNWKPEEGDKAFAQELLSTYQQRSEFFRRGVMKVKDVEQLLRSWQESINQRRQQVPVKERVTDIFSSAVQVVTSIWNYELFTVEDTLVVDGQEITGKRSVTVDEILFIILLLTIGLWLSRHIAQFARRLMLKQFRVEDGIAILIQRGVYIVLFLVVVLTAMTLVKIPLTVFAFLGGALAIGIGFGAQNLLNNFISGIILLLERPIKIGDIVEVDGVRGRVVSIGSRCSQVHRFDGIDMLIPNSSLLEKNVINWTLSDSTLRFSVSVGVAYGSSPRDTVRLVTRAVEEHGKVLRAPEPLVLFEDFGENALKFTVYFWLEVTPDMDYRVVESDIRHRIEKLFNEGGITIAYPQRDIHFDASSPLQVEVMRPDHERAFAGMSAGRS